MTCEKCGYQDKQEKVLFNKKLCSVCSRFAPDDKQQFEEYVSEKIDWKILETFRKYNQSAGQKQKKSNG